MTRENTNLKLLTYVSFKLIKILMYGLIENEVNFLPRSLRISSFILPCENFEQLETVNNKKTYHEQQYPNVTWRISSYLFTYLRLSMDSHWTKASIVIPMDLNILCSTLMCGLLGPLYTIYWVTSYLRLLALSILTCSPNMSLQAWLDLDNSRSLEKHELGTPATPKDSARGLSSCL